MTERTIPNKAQFMALYHRGYFGNKFASWDSYTEFAEDPREFPFVALRARSKPGIQLPSYCLPMDPNSLYQLYIDWIINFGMKPEDITVSECAPDYAIQLQGEIMRSINYYDLTFTTVKKMMRTALREQSHHLSGVAASQLLQSQMDAPSWDNLMRIFDEFPDDIVEFSVFSRPVGELNLNTVIWEVRNY